MRWLDRAAVLAWWQLAQSDLRVARAVAGMDPPEWHIVCFLSQQAGEKALKALLEALDQPVPRSHDLGLLAERMQHWLPVHEIANAALLLSAFGVGPRYPSPAGPSTEDDAGQALEAAARVLEWAGGHLARSSE